MRRLSYSKAEALVECARKGDAMHRRVLPPPTADQATRILRGHVIDHVVAMVYEQGWYALALPTAEALILDAVTETFTRLRREVVPGPLTLTEAALRAELTALRTIPTQMVTHGLVPGEFRVQANLEAPLLAGPDTPEARLVGGLDLLVENDHGVALVDVKAGTYRKPMQLAWYRLLAAEYGIRPTRLGFWMPLSGELQWVGQATLADPVPFARQALVTLETNDTTPSPGVVCKMCGLRTTCTEGVAYLARQAALHDRLGGVSGIERWSWSQRGQQ
jgi:hypothetical protein